VNGPRQPGFRSRLACPRLAARRPVVVPSLPDAPAFYGDLCRSRGNLRFRRMPRARRKARRGSAGRCRAGPCKGDAAQGREREKKTEPFSTFHAGRMPGRAPLKRLNASRGARDSQDTGSVRGARGFAAAVPSACCLGPDGEHVAQVRMARHSVGLWYEKTMSRVVRVRRFKRSSVRVSAGGAWDAAIRCGRVGSGDGLH